MTRPLWQYQEEIGRRLATAQRRLLCFDFDGTLAPFVAIADRVQLGSKTRESLRALAARQGIDVAIVSGRALPDVRRRVDLPQLIFAGNHGFEIYSEDFTFIEPTARSLCGEMHTFAMQLENELRAFPEALVENKGLTISVHFRQVPPQLQLEVKDVVVRAMCGKEQFSIREGSMVIEILPRVDWDKGAAVNWIRTQLDAVESAVVYVGDDRTDEDAFRALPQEITVKVGVSPTMASYYVESSDEIPRFLELLNSISATWEPQNNSKR